MIPAGERRAYVEFQEPILEASRTGDVTTSGYQTWGYAWGKMEQLTAAERTNALIQQLDITHKFTMPWMPNFHNDLRAVYKGRPMEVEAWNNVGEDDAEIVCNLREVV